MKTYIAILAILLSTSFIAFNAGKRTQKHDNFKADRYAAEWGCYAGAEMSCLRLKEDKDIAECRENALTNCPKAGEAFEAFLMQSYKKLTK